jgi:hypothetical protein
MGTPSQTRGERHGEVFGVEEGSWPLGDTCTGESAPDVVPTAREAARRAGGGVYDVGDGVIG